MFLPTKPPEVLSREPYGHAVDWWSLGVIACRMLTNQYPTPAIRKRATVVNDGNGKLVNGSPEDLLPSTSIVSVNAQRQNCVQPVAGTLPETAAGISQAARGLLTRLLERDPQVRMRNLRQLQQSAFYMRFNFEQVKTKKVAPRSVLEGYFPEIITTVDLGNHNATEEMFSNFSQL